MIARFILAAAMVGVAGGTAWAAPDFSQVGAGAWDIAQRCASPHDHNLQARIVACTQVTEMTVYHGQSWPYSIRGLTYLRLHNFDAAIADLNEAVLLAPKGDKALPVYYHDRCDVFADAGRASEALADCNSSLALRPGDGYTLGSRCFAEYRLGQYATAIADCTAGLAAAPKDQYALYIRGLAEQQSGNTPGGDADVAAAKAMDAGVGETFADYGVDNAEYKCFYRSRHEPQAAIDACGQVMQTPALAALAWPYLGRGRAYETLGKKDLSLADFNQAVVEIERAKSDPMAGPVYNERCYLLAELGQNLDQALSDCNKAIAAQPDSFNFVDSRAFVEYRLGSYAAAIADCGAALAKNQKMPSSLYVRGLAEIATGNAAGGNADIAAAEAIDGKIADEFASYGIKAP